MNMEEITLIIFEALKLDDRVLSLKLMMDNKGIQVCTVDGEIYNLGGRKTQRKFVGKIDYVKQSKDGE